MQVYVKFHDILSRQILRKLFFSIAANENLMHIVEIPDFRPLENNSVALKLYRFIFIICHSFYRDHQRTQITLTTVVYLKENVRRSKLH